MAPAIADTNVGLVPHLAFTEAPKHLNVLFVPGGSRGTLAAMNDAETIAFVADRGKTATWVTSVCTGSLVLGPAGLLQGRRATSHWIVRETALPLFGATPVTARRR